jgi:hypothetical protein
VDDTTAAGGATLPPEPREELRPEQRRRPTEQQTLSRFRVAAVALPIGVAAFSFAGLKRLDSSSLGLAAYATVTCAVLLGLAYWLGRTRPAPGTAQRLNLLGKIISVIPILGLTRIALMDGVYQVTKRRLACRNIAILAAIWLVGAAFEAADTAVADIAALLAVVAVVLAVVVARRLPAAHVPAPTDTAPPVRDAGLPRAAGNDRVGGAAEAGLPSERPAELPEPTRVADLTPLAAAARRLYWLVGSVKFGAIFLAFGILAPNNEVDATWARGIVAWIGALAVLGVAVAMQEGRVRPRRGLLLGGILVVLVCLGGVAFGAVTGSDAQAGIIGWALWPAICYQPYRRQRKRSGLTDDVIQAASRVGHLPTRSGRHGRWRPAVRPAAWVRAIAGAICAVPIVLIGLFNSLAGVPLLSDLIGAVLDKLFGLAHGSVDALLAGLDPDEEPAIALAESAEPQAWRLLVRGDLFQFGKVGPQRVAFEEFLHARLETYGEVQAVREAAAGAAQLVVMPVAVPYDDQVRRAAWTLAGRMPLLLLVPPIGGRALERWPVLARQLRGSGIMLPGLSDPAGTIAVLHLVTGDNIVYLARKRDQWAYLTAIYEALFAISRQEDARPSTHRDAGAKEPSVQVCDVRADPG